MKKTTALIVTLLMVCIAMVNCQKTEILEGVWQMIDQKMKFPNETINHSEFVNPVIKIFTSEHFSSSGLCEDNQFVGHFGKYSYDGEAYTEHIKYSALAALMGQSVTMKSKMDGDNWMIEGVLFFEGEKIKFYETWQRIE